MGSSKAGRSHAALEERAPAQLPGNYSGSVPVGLCCAEVVQFRTNDGCPPGLNAPGERPGQYPGKPGSRTFVIGVLAYARCDGLARARCGSTSCGWRDAPPASMPAAVPEIAPPLSVSAIATQRFNKASEAARVFYGGVARAAEAGCLHHRS
jgi:hypothetical protein